jgi:hypothetical protein
LSDPLSQSSPPPLFAGKEEPAELSPADRAEAARCTFEAVIVKIDFAIDAQLRAIANGNESASARSVAQTIILQAQALKPTIKSLEQLSAHLGRLVTPEGGVR